MLEVASRSPDYMHAPRSAFTSTFFISVGVIVTAVNLSIGGAQIKNLYQFNFRYLILMGE